MDKPTSPTKVYLVDGELYLEEGAELTKLVPPKYAVRRQRNLDGYELAIGFVLGAVVALLRFVLQ